EESPMVHASARGWRRGRVSALILGGLLVAGVTGLSQMPATAQTKPGGTVGKGPDTPPSTLKMNIASKDGDVKEMSTVINAKLEAGWKANKITPSVYIDDYEFLRRATLDIVGRIAKPEE